MARRTLFKVLALGAALAPVATACGEEEGGGSGGGGEAEIDCAWKIGTVGALAGDYATLGMPIFDGIEYAVNEANEAGEVPCELEIAREDSQGSSEQAPPLAQSLVQ